MILILHENGNLQQVFTNTTPTDDYDLENKVLIRFSDGRFEFFDPEINDWSDIEALQEYP